MKTKTKDILTLIKEAKLDWVNPDINSTNFPPEEIRGKLEVLHFGTALSTEEAIKEIKSKGYEPANLYELVSYVKDWNEENDVIALGSVFVNPGGDRCSPYLDRGDAERNLRLTWHDNDWDVHCRFLVVRKSGISPSDSSPASLDSLTLDRAIEICKENGLKIIKEL